MALGIFPLVLSQTTTGAILLSSSVGNGSFEDALFTTGTTLVDGVTISDTTPSLTNQTGGEGPNAPFLQQRVAATGGGTIVIPGWTLTATGTFAGIDYSGSTASSDGSSHVVANSNSSISGTTATIALDSAAGDSLAIGAAFGARGSSIGDYTLSLIFEDASSNQSTVLVGLADTAIAGGLGTANSGPAVPFPTLVDANVTIPDGSVSVQLQFELTGGQVMADNFTLEQVPEPSSALLAGLSLIGLLRRQRQ